jgi:methylmalonyl-CoA/ethylmalonyl-CoA epimerase
MIGKLNHVAIVVPDLSIASSLYRDAFGADVSAPVDLPAQGVTTVFVNLPNTKIELLHPLGEDSPVAKFLANNPKGGMHHVCYEVTDLPQAIAKLSADGMTVLGGGKPSIGAHGLPVVFLHPKDALGTLVELEEVER